MAAVKRSPDYHEICGMIEPDPTDSTVSKRKWEKSIQFWRKALRDDMAASNGQDMEDLSIDDVVLDDSLQWLAEPGLIRQARAIIRPPACQVSGRVRVRVIPQA